MNNKILVLKMMQIIPDYIFNSIIFTYKLKYLPRFKKPRSLNEKINYIKLYSENRLRETVADRIKVRDYVRDKSAGCELIKLLWQGRYLDPNSYNKLPKKFVIKANHGSGMVRIVDKNTTTYQTLISEISEWMNYDYGKLTRQWMYKNLEKKFIVEEFIEFGSRDLPDYKFFCFNGKVELIQVDLDRFNGHKRNLYDNNFKLLDERYIYENGDNISKPKLLDKAIQIAEKLSEEFDFIRVDLYILNNRIYFGEMTNTPENGIGSFYPKEFDFYLGSKLKFEKELTKK